MRLECLPHDVLSHIVELLDVAAQYNMTRTSRKLAECSTRLYLRSRGCFLGGESSVTLTIVKLEGYQCLPVWRRAPFFGSIDVARFQFSNLAAEAAEESRLLCKFFGELSPSLASVFIKRIQINWLSLSPYGLLDVVEEALKFELCYINLRGSQSAAAGMVMAKARLPSGRRRDSQITSFRVLSPLYFSNTVSRATFEVIASSPLQQLHLYNCGFSAAQWATFLPLIQLPRLSDFGLDGSATYTTFHKFIARHPLLSLVSFNTTTCPSTSLLPHSIELPHLQELQGPAAYLRMLFDALSTVPDLRFLGVVPDVQKTEGEGNDGMTQCILHFKAVQSALTHALICDKLSIIRVVFPLTQSKDPFFGPAGRATSCAENQLRSVRSVEIGCLRRHNIDDNNAILVSDGGRAHLH